jgi:hypothetical protein
MTLVQLQCKNRTLRAKAYMWRSHPVVLRRMTAGALTPPYTVDLVMAEAESAGLALVSSALAGI